MALTKQKKISLSRSPSQQLGNAEKEEQLYNILIESFEELLATEYIELQLGEE